jgi:hypothetical protein
MRNVVAIVVLLMLLVVALAFAWFGWTGLAGVDLSVGGYIALAGGVVAALAIGCGLMALMFYSHRHGYDESAEREDRSRPRR